MKTGQNINMTIQSNNQKHWVVTIQADPEDPETLVLPFPDDLLEEAGWNIGDTLVWTIEDNRVIISKQ